MARRCAVTGKGVQFGNYVSHANNKTRRRFEPNLQNVSLESEASGRPVRLRVSMHGLRSIEHRGGVDAYLLSARDIELSLDARRLKKRIAALKAAQTAAA